MHPCLLPPCEHVYLYAFLYFHGNVYQRVFALHIDRVGRMLCAVLQIAQAVQLQFCPHAF